MRKYVISLFFIVAFFFSSCNGLLDEEDVYGQRSNFILQDRGGTSGSSFNVLLFSDVHVGRKERVGQSYDPYGSLDQWVERGISSLHPDLVICLGDITDSSTAQQYAQAREFFENVQEKVGETTYVAKAIGNHDNRGDGRKRFSEVLGSPMYQAFSYGGYSFYILDSSPRSVSKPQMEKLKRAVFEDSQPKFFLTHYPLSASSFTYYYLALSDSEQRDEMIDLMLGHNVGLWLAGHRHHREGPFEFSRRCHELTLASLNGLDDGWESPPTWYVMEVKDHTAVITEYEWHEGDSQGRKTGTLSFPLSP